MILAITFFNLFVSVIMGALIGYERQYRQRTAGLRTNALVALGSASFVTVSFLVADEISPTRIAAQVVSGIGFLCAGVIMRDGLGVRGLNTAATVWCSAAVGVMCGSGFMIEAAMVTILVLGAHLVLRPLGNKINATSIEEAASLELTGSFSLSLTVATPDCGQARNLMVQLVSYSPLSIKSLDARQQSSDGTTELFVELNGQENQSYHLEQMASRLQLEKGVLRVAWRFVNENEASPVSFVSSHPRVV